MQRAGCAGRVLRDEDDLSGLAQVVVVVRDGEQLLRLEHGDQRSHRLTLGAQSVREVHQRRAAAHEDDPVEDRPTRRDDFLSRRGNRGFDAVDGGGADQLSLAIEHAQRDQAVRAAERGAKRLLHACNGDRRAASFSKL